MPEPSSSAAPTAALPFERREGGLRLAVRLTPRASRAKIGGVERDADGLPHLRVRVTTPPEGGKANAALVRLLAKEWKLPAGAVRIAAGAKGRVKTVELAGDSATLASRLSDWMNERHG